MLAVLPKTSYAKIKEGIFVGTSDREVIEHEQEVMIFLETRKVITTSKLLLNYCELGALVSLKMHFLHSHLDFFPRAENVLIRI